MDDTVDDTAPIVSEASARLADARAELARRHGELEAATAEKSGAEAAWLTEAEGGEETAALCELRDAFHAAELREREAAHRLERAHTAVEASVLVLEGAREAERVARKKAAAEAIMAADRKIDRDRRKLAQSLVERQKLGDEAIIACAGQAAPGPTLRQIRGEPAIAGFVLEALWPILPRAVPRPAGGYHRYAGLTAFERRIFRPWLNGTADEAGKPSTEEQEK